MAKQRHAIFGLVVAIGAASSVGGAAFADQVQSATAQIDQLDAAVLAATRTGGGETNALTPVVASVFDLSVMAQFIVGPGWGEFSAADKQSVISALNTYVAARLNDEFDGNAQQIDLSRDVQMRGPDAMVHTQVTQSGQAPDNVDYRMRQYDGAWRVIDVYDNGVSVLATQRGDAQAALQQGGAQALARRLRDNAAAFH